METNDFEEIRHNVIELCKKKINEGADRIVEISTAGSVDNSGVVISAGNFRNYCNISWQDLLSEELGKTIVDTVNDGRASAWGEYMVSEDKANTHVHVVIGTGIGGGVIHNGDLLKGDSGQAGYIGHIKVTPLKTPICSCGKMGCAESLASARGIVAYYNEKMEKQVSFDEMMSNAMNDIEAVNAAFVESGYWLGVALGNVMNVLNPQRITIGGGVILAVNDFMDILKIKENPYLLTSSGEIIQELDRFEWNPEQYIEEDGVRLFEELARRIKKDYPLKSMVFIIYLYQKQRNCHGQPHGMLSILKKAMIRGRIN